MPFYSKRNDWAVLTYQTVHFVRFNYLRDAVLARRSRVRAYVSVSLSVTSRKCVKTAQQIELASAQRFSRAVLEGYSSIRKRALPSGTAS